MIDSPPLPMGYWHVAQEGSRCRGADSCISHGIVQASRTARKLHLNQVELRDGHQLQRIKTKELRTLGENRGPLHTISLTPTKYLHLPPRLRITKYYYRKQCSCPR